MPHLLSLLYNIAMRKIVPLLLVIGLIAMWSCKKPAPATGSSLKLQLNPMFGGVPMKLNTTYQSPDGKYYFFDVLNIYLSHIKLIQANGAAVEVNPVVYISINDSANATPVINLTAATGSFTAVQFSIGLDSAQDNTPPTSNISSPYYDDGVRYWGSPLNYVFIELAGYGDTAAIPVRGIGYHVGTAPYYTTVTIPKAISLTGSSQTTLVLNMDLQRLFYGGTNPINVMIQSEDITSTSPNPALCQQFVTNMDSSFSLQ
jgi:hypothetical protein